ncbi:MAG: UPF0158 family protein [Betaproteobacteria bacterium]|nr:UPF0158 family protein [Betaproteobacteria bacterium]
MTEKVKVSVYLEDVAGEMEMINNESSIFYNMETGEFVFYSEHYSDEAIDLDEFEEDKYVCLPSQFDIDEYSIMRKFVEDVEDARKQELLSVALEGKGAFRRFKDTLHRVDMTDKWYAYKTQAFIEIAREWCEENGIPYKDKKRT